LSHQPSRPQSIPQQPKSRKPSRPRISKDDITNGFVLAANTSRKVIRVGTDIVAKFGREVNLAEAESMTFIRDNTTIPVPEVLDVYSQDGANHIIMEYVGGVLLNKVLETLSADDKSTITNELKDYIRQMRQLSPPEDMLIGSVVGGPAVDRRQLGSAVGGPFRSEDEFNEWQLAQLYPGIPLSQREMYAAVHRSDHQILFAHGDLAFHNIIVEDMGISKPLSTGSTLVGTLNIGITVRLFLSLVEQKKAIWCASRYTKNSITRTFS
jgi:Phosphotransferase enzyme family